MGQTSRMKFISLKNWQTRVSALRSTGSWVASIAVALVFFALETSGSAFEDQIRKSFSATAGGKLVVEADRGSINVQTADQKSVSVQITRTVDLVSRARAEAILKEHQITMDQDGNLVRIRAKAPKQVFSFFWNRGWSRLKVQYQLTVPRTFNLDLRTAGGNIHVPDLAGAVRAVTAGGNVTLKRIQGPVFAETAGGDVSVDGATEAVEARTAGGNIHLGAMEGHAQAHTSGGSIRIDQAKGKVAAHTAGGNIDISQAAEALEAHTSGGNITASFATQPRSDCVLRTTGGNIKVGLADTFKLDIDASATGGRVTTDVPVTVQGEVRRHQLKGTLNGGGPNLTLSTIGGSIHLQKR